MIRSFLVFFAALFLGALTVSGQDAEADKLRDRVRALTAELKARADKMAPEDAAVGRVVRRFYEVGALAQIVHDSDVPQVDIKPSKFQWAEQPEREPRSGLELDAIADLLRIVIEPETWDSVEGAEVSVMNNRILVSNIPRVHKKVEPFLRRLSREFIRELRIEIVAVPMLPEDESLLANRTRELTDEEASRLLGREPLASADLRCRSGQQVSSQMGAKVNYLHDYDVEIAQEATIGDPIPAVAFSGCTAAVRAFLDEGASGARLDLQLALTALDRPMRRVDTEHGPLELPAMALTRLRTSLWVPLDHTCIVGGSWAGKVPCLFVATVRRAGVNRR
jgi:hypothetical protein